MLFVLLVSKIIEISPYGNSYTLTINLLSPNWILLKSQPRLAGSFLVFSVPTVRTLAVVPFSLKLNGRVVAVIGFFKLPSATTTTNNDSVSPVMRQGFNRFVGVNGEILHCWHINNLFGVLKISCLGADKLAPANVGCYLFGRAKRGPAPVQHLVQFSQYARQVGGTRQDQHPRRLTGTLLRIFQ